MEIERKVMVCRAGAMDNISKANGWADTKTVRERCISRTVATIKASFAATSCTVTVSTAGWILAPTRASGSTTV